MGQMVPVSEDNLPVLLPSDIQFTGRGPSPLTQARDWLRASCGRYATSSSPHLLSHGVVMPLQCGTGLLCHHIS